MPNAVLGLGNLAVIKGVEFALASLCRPGMDVVHLVGSPCGCQTLSKVSFLKRSRLGRGVRVPPNHSYPWKAVTA